MRGLSWREFEQLLAEAYRRRGYSVEETIGGADGGVDLVLAGREAGHRMTVYVQCKQYRDRQVGVKVVRELAGVVSASGGQAMGVRGVVVSSGEFTDEALRFAEKAGVELIDGVSLVRMLKDVRESAERRAVGVAPGRAGAAAEVAGVAAPARPAMARGGAGRVTNANARSTGVTVAARAGSAETSRRPAPAARPRAWEASPAGSAVADPAPACPLCGAKMTRRVARKGPNAGSAFWGCPRFPDCRGTPAAG